MKFLYMIPENFKNIVQNISRENIHMMMVFSVVKKILEHNSMMYAPGLGTKGYYNII